MVGERLDVSGEVDMPVWSVQSASKLKVRNNESGDWLDSADGNGFASLTGAVACGLEGGQAAIEGQAPVDYLLSSLQVDLGNE
jgi:hypothetical protein